MSQVFNGQTPTSTDKATTFNSEEVCNWEMEGAGSFLLCLSPSDSEDTFVGISGPLEDPFGDDSSKPEEGHEVIWEGTKTLEDTDNINNATCRTSYTLQIRKLTLPRRTSASVPITDIVGVVSVDGIDLFRMPSIVLGDRGEDESTHDWASRAGSALGYTSTSSPPHSSPSSTRDEEQGEPSTDGIGSSDDWQSAVFVLASPSVPDTQDQEDLQIGDDVITDILMLCVPYRE